MTNPRLKKKHDVSITPTLCHFIYIFLYDHNLNLQTIRTSVNDLIDAKLIVLTRVKNCGLNVFEKSRFFVKQKRN